MAENIEIPKMGEHAPYFGNKRTLIGNSPLTPSLNGLFQKIESEKVRRNREATSDIIIIIIIIDLRLYSIITIATA
jgi:hypothetical protein